MPTAMITITLALVSPSERWVTRSVSKAARRELSWPVIDYFDEWAAIRELDVGFARADSDALAHTVATIVSRGWAA